MRSGGTAAKTWESRGEAPYEGYMPKAVSAWVSKGNCVLQGSFRAVPMTSGHARDESESSGDISEPASLAWLACPLARQCLVFCAAALCGQTAPRGANPKQTAPRGAVCAHSLVLSFCASDGWAA